MAPYSSPPFGSCTICFHYCGKTTWCFQPIWKILASQIGSFPQFSDWKIPKIFELPPPQKNLIHPRKLTWNLKMMVSNRNLLFQGFIFRFHVSFPGRNPILFGILAGSTAQRLRQKLPKVCNDHLSCWGMARVPSKVRHRMNPPGFTPCSARSGGVLLTVNIFNLAKWGGGWCCSFIRMLLYYCRYNNITTL